LFPLVPSYPLFLSPLFAPTPDPFMNVIPYPLVPPSNLQDLGFPFPFPLFPDSNSPSGDLLSFGPSLSPHSPLYPFNLLRLLFSFLFFFCSSDGGLPFFTGLWSQYFRYPPLDSPSGFPIPLFYLWTPSPCHSSPPSPTFAFFLCGENLLEIFSLLLISFDLHFLLFFLRLRTLFFFF